MKEEKNTYNADGLKEIPAITNYAENYSLSFIIEYLSHYDISDNWLH